VLAGDAVLGPRNGFQALGPNQASAGQAFTKIPISNAVQGGFNQMQHPVTVMSLSEEEFLGRAIDSTIGDIQCGFIDQFAPFACHVTGSHAKFRQPALQPCLKFSDLPFVQSGFVCHWGHRFTILVSISSTEDGRYSVKSAHNFWPLHEPGQCCQLGPRV
jgi:hypothetical protein